MTRTLRAFALAAALVATLAGCGGGGGGGSQTPPPDPGNVTAVVVSDGPGNFFNLPFVTVTICAPGSSTNCQTVDHVIVDTGSTGLRIMASALSPALSLRPQTDASGNPLAECAQFADGFTWGSVSVADVRIAGQQANSVPIQVIGDPSFPAIPSSCSSTGPPENDPATFGGNGLLGIGYFLQDCGSICAQFTIPGFYYSCPAAGCAPARVPVAQQLQNPVALFPVNNNGSIIALPAIAAAGAATATGSLTFGIGTQTNNALANATVLTVGPTGYVTTIFGTRAYASTYIDAGANITYFGTGAYPDCGGDYAGFYCPATTQFLMATIQGTNGASAAVNFSIGNASQLFTANPTFYAFNNIGASEDDSASFTWGLTFFYGRRVFTAIEQRNTPGGVGPYVAF